MSQPAVNQTEIDGALGVLPSAGGLALALVGFCSLGTGVINVPAAFARTKDVIAWGGGGPLVEAACYYIDNYQKPVLVCATGKSTLGTYVGGTPTVTGAGTSVVTFTGATEPLDDFELSLIFDVGATIGVAGALYRLSFDGGRNYGPQTALGTANVLALGAGCSLSFAAGTVLAGQTITGRTTAPCPNGTELNTALDAIKASGIPWRTLLVTCPLDATLFGNVSTKIANKRHDVVANTRMPTVAESEAAYATALTTIFASLSSSYIELCAGACELTSAVSGRKYRRPVAFAVGAAEGSVSEEIDTADVNRGALPGVSIQDANGNPKHHDESLNPGLDDLRFTVLRTWDDFQGIYINRPRLFSATGSDFSIAPMRRILNLVHRTAKLYAIRRLNQPLEVNRKTGYLQEATLGEIESGCNAAFAAALAGKKTSATLALSRTDNILSTKTLSGSYRDLPPAYIEQANLDGGFSNPVNVSQF